MAREFELVKLKDQIQRIEDIDGLRQLAVDLTDLNYRLKEVIASQVLEQIHNASSAACLIFPRARGKPENPARPRGVAYLLSPQVRERHRGDNDYAIAQRLTVVRWTP